MESLCKLFSTDLAQKAQKALDYLDGHQLEYVVSMLNEANFGRVFWKEKGQRPRYRNLTKRVVEKSSQLFNDEPPAFEVWMGGEQPDELQTDLLTELLYKAEHHSCFVNLDQTTRLLKTTLLLTQYDEYNDCLIFDLLHRGNAYVKYDPVSRKPIKLIYKIENDNDSDWEYFRIFTEEKIEDWKEQKTKYDSYPELISSEDNPFGCVPVSVFYDTTMPRTGFWNYPGCDLIDFNDAYNMHLVDMDFAASWSVNQTLFTNVNFDEDEVPGQTNVEEQYKEPLPRYSLASPTQTIMGLSKIVHIDTTGVEEVYLEFKGPNVDFQGPTKMFNTWMHDYASDWSVRIKMTDQANAQSGFQLVVEEIDNLELRRHRSRMMEKGLKQLVYVIFKVWNTVHPNSFSEEATCNVDIPAPNLPVDTKQQEETWSLKIGEGRASRVDYFMRTEGMKREEAEAKVKEIEEYEGQGGVEVPTFVEEL